MSKRELGLRRYYYREVVDSLLRILQIWRFFGFRWLMFRVWYAIRLRTGLIRLQLPMETWDARPLVGFLSLPELLTAGNYLNYRQQKSPPFFFEAAKISEYRGYFEEWDAAASNSPVRVAKNLAQGKISYFQKTSVELGFPPAWSRNPFTLLEVPAGSHWSLIDDFAWDDIKVIWEPSRFGFVYAIVRAYWRTGDEQYPEMFWQVVEDWRRHNMPQRGPNWKCGQETSLRTMAWCFGLYGFLFSKATTLTRVCKLAQMIAVSGLRIEGNLSYGLSQQNNHGISEALGLWTIGSLFPEFTHASRWRELGRRTLEQQGRNLIYSDGSFCQHSINYHRMMLHSYLWCLRLGDLTGKPFTEQLHQRVQNAGTLLYQLCVGQRGQVPAYGQNDGSLILPLSNCDYLDYRPVIQAIHYLTTGERCYQSGIWDEDLLWLFGPTALESPILALSPDELAAEQGGYYTLRSGTSFAFVHCGTYRHRPGQADMLHVDLWWHGVNMAVDAGTFSYNAPQPWDNPLAGSSFHNTVTVDGKDQMVRVGKFLWLPWIEGDCQVRTKSSSGGSLSFWQGKHNGYSRLPDPVEYRRGILRIGSDTWLVLDQLDSPAEHEYRLHWLFPDLPYAWNKDSGQLTIHASPGDYHVMSGNAWGPTSFSLAKAQDKSPRGWQATYYYYRQPALSFDARAIGSRARLWTLLGPHECQISVEKECLRIVAAKWEVNLALRGALQGSILESVQLSGLHNETLEILA